MRTLNHKNRISSIDFLRGLAITFMVLDHTRFFLYSSPHVALDINNTSPGLFLTRWVTHFCAPTFILLAGISAGFVIRKRGVDAASVYLFKRGLCLIALELTVVRLGFIYFDINVFTLQVMFAIGCSMLILSFLIRLNKLIVLLLSCVILFFHNLLDTVWLPVLHDQFYHEFISGWWINVIYPIIPWPFLMAVGYCLYFLYDKEAVFRQKVLVGMGLAMLIMFCVIRILNFYGDPIPFQQYDSFLLTLFSFINCHKYPPSLLFLLMTLSLPLMLLGYTDRMNSHKNIIVYMGYNPLLMYIVHLYVLRIIKKFILSNQYCPVISRTRTVGYGFVVL